MINGCIHPFFLQKWGVARDMTQHLEARAALQENPSSVPSTHIE